ncbi:DNA-binding transcriptional MerR regulator [Lipingzhangella halophila]|uniref:DNA-binding transcriptional MerR regulator n=1 Tax=Lipingzhangella halophila TaxID=1783352 RepID=A0A7W7RHA2_9ACTN|nr:TipAS antibiotic-recognition domain-containing protein [Lipingzhangella halophila]MBB4932001.1 DNA-binding transcriptional MerR regulator [Lipingzhangella halophila]
MPAEWSIQEVAHLAGTTSRTLRHYDHIGLLRPSRVGKDGHRFYDQHCLVRLQRVLLLRELGLGLAAITEVLAGEQDAAAALRTHLALLERERERIGRQIESVRTTLRKTEEEEQLMADEILDGFHHEQYKDEMIQQWGREAYESGAQWWRSLSKQEQDGFQRQQREIASDFGAALTAGRSPDSDEVQAIAQRQYEWVTLGWQGRNPTAEQFAGLGQMYVDDPRFTATYDRHGAGTAAFVRDTMRVYAERELR